MTSDTTPTNPNAYQNTDSGSRKGNSLLNKLRAAVLGANDGVVSLAGIMTGVAGATTEFFPILTAGVAGVSAGALSMAVGEFVSVSAQRDTESSLLAKEKLELESMPDEELKELAGFYVEKGLTPDLAEEVALQLHAHDALAAHAETELRIDPDDLTNPWEAAGSSALAFTVGSMFPFLAMLLSPAALRIPITIVAVVFALIMTGYFGAKAGGTPKGRSILRNVIGGLLAMAITYTIGHLVGTSVA